jgi:serine/threonine-protein kinase
VDRLIGRGGMGEVYLARHRHLDREVALKVLQPELADNEAFRERFIRESRSAAALHHPNIVTVYDAGEIDGLLYIAMQYIDGPDLATVLHAEGPLPAFRCMSIVDQLAQALEAAHARGLIHRDVKPGNVLIDEERVYLTDFGLTKPVAVKTAVTKPGQFVGTIDYTAVEQIRGATIDTRADVYSLGCLMYRALTGEPPFARDNDVAVIHGHLYDPIPRITDKRPDLPPAMDDVIDTALAKDPDDRYGSATALAVAGNHALSRRSEVREERPTMVVSGGAPAEKPTGPTARLGRPGNRWRVPASRIAVPGVAAFAAAAVIAVVASGGDNPPPDDKKPPPTKTHSQPEPVDPVVVDRPTHVGYLPTGLAIGVGGVFAANEGDGTLRRIEPYRDRLESVKAVIGGGPSSVAVGADGAWVTSRKTNTLTRVDPRTMQVIARIPVGRAPNAVAIGNNDYSVWVSNELDNTVTRIDPNTNAANGAPYKVGLHPRALATIPDVVYVANRGDGTVSRISVPKRKVADTFRTGRRPTALVIAGKVLWVANAGDGSVVEVNMQTDKIIKRVHVGGHPYALAGTLRYVFVGDRGGNRLVRINIATGKLAGSPIKVRDPFAMRSGGGAIWVANRAGNNVTRIRLL